MSLLGLSLEARKRHKQRQFISSLLTYRSQFEMNCLCLSHFVRYRCRSIICAFPANIICSLAFPSCLRSVAGSSGRPGGARMTPWRFGPTARIPQDPPDPLIVTTGRSPGRADPSFLAIKLQGTLLAAGPGFARIPFY